MWFIVLIVWAILIKNAKKKKKILLISVFVIYFFSNSFIISEFYRLWEVQPVYLNNLDEHYDVGVVLGGGMITFDSLHDRYTFRTNTDRILQAVYLYDIKRIKKILISGGSGNLIFRDMLESVCLKNFLVSTLHIPDEDILVDSVSDNTYQNARESAKILKDNFKNPKVLLITSAFHMRRAKMCFNKQGIPTTVYATDITTGPHRFQFDFMFLPSMQSLLLWNKLFHELIGIAIYKIMGYA